MLQVDWLTWLYNYIFGPYHDRLKHICVDTKNSEIFARIIFSRITLKYVFAMLTIHN